MRPGRVLSERVGRRSLKTLVVAVSAACALLAAGIALGATSFSDSTGDHNASPDISGVTISEENAVLTLRVAVANYQTLPVATWFNIWFDTDRNSQTGDIAGDEKLVQFFQTGEVKHAVWDGAEWADAPATGVTGSYAAGALTLTVPTSLIGSSDFGLLAVAARGQQLSGELLVASDLAPNSGRSPFTSPTPASHPDPTNDHNAAPDIARVRVTDAKDGWIRFAITTPNRATLPAQSVIILAIDRDAKPRTGAAGSEVSITDTGGEVRLERWNTSLRRWVDDTGRTRLKERSAGNVVTIEVHRSELDNTPRFGFKLASGDLDVATAELVAVDFAPDSGRFWSYQLANPVFRLLAGKASGVPVRPLAGKLFAVRRGVTRSDTHAAVTSGRVTCTASLGGQRVAAKGSLARGLGRCTMRIPAGSKGKRLRGTMTVRSGGKSVTSTFTYVVG